MLISFFPSVTNAKDSQEKELKDIFASIKDDTYKDSVTKVRAEQDKEKRRILKKNLLPAVTFAGTFSYRDKNNIKKTSGLACLDFDDYTRGHEIKKDIQNYPFVISAFFSPSGGVKAIVKIPCPKDHIEYEAIYLQLIDKLSSMPGIGDSVVTRDIARLCFLSHDPEIYINPEASDFRVDRSRLEFFVVRNLIREGKTREEIFSYMATYSKWSSDSEHYRKRTYEKALNNSVQQVSVQPRTDVHDIVNASDLLSKPAPKLSYIVDGLVVEGGITLFGSEPAGGKSLLTIDMAVAIARGELWLGQGTKQRSVLVIDGENGVIATHRRLSLLSHGTGWKTESLSDNLHISFIPELCLDTEVGKVALRSMIEQCDAEVIIIDPLVAFMEGDENASTDMRMVRACLKPFAEEGKTFIVCHHLSKHNTGSGMDRLRGSGDLAALADIVVLLSGKGIKAVKVEKHRHEALEDAVGFCFTIENPIGDVIKLVRHEMKEKAQPIEQCKDDICDWLESNEVLTFQSGQILAVMKERGHTRSTIYEALNALRASKVIASGQTRGQWTNVQVQNK